MPRPQRRQTNRRSAAERSPIRRWSASGRPLQEPTSATSSPGTSTTTPLALDGSMADRYYAMAENMNTRGAMEMAVPFYRQAITMLMAERASLQQKLGGADAQTVAQDLPVDELHGLLEAAEALVQSPSTPIADSLSADVSVQEATVPSIDVQIAELACELGKENALQVIAGLRSLSDVAGGQLPSNGLALLGKAQMLLGKLTEGLKSFEAALAMAPSDQELLINTGAARLANGDAQGALALLRNIWDQGFEVLQPSSQRALLRNLSAAEAKAGHLAAALQVRLKWFQQDPQALPLHRWLSWAQQGLTSADKASPVRQGGLALLQALQQTFPNEPSVLKALAEALEDQGDYRQAALLYRQLLRP